MQVKPLIGIYHPPEQHWVGDGFPVRTLFAYGRMGRQISPFLLLDYAGPAEFTPTDKPRGVGEHPHRGFETVTIVFDGEVDHRDSSGGGGSIGPGDVQWMTAGSGLMHAEFHSPAFTSRGGRFEVAQLWVNLPAEHKMTAPRYQAILARDIPVVGLPDEGGRLRVIAGRFGDARGPADTFTDMNVWDLTLDAGHTIELPLPEEHNGVIAVLRGRVELGGGEALGDADFALHGTTGDGILLRAVTNAHVLVLGGTAIEEPIAGYGPFVMNTREEIIQAFADLESGRFGRLADS